MRRVLGVLLGIVAVAGCGWTEYAADAHHSRSNPFDTAIGTGNLGTLTKAWDSPVPARTEPVVRGARVFTTSTHTLYALDAATGAVLWSLADTGQTGDAYTPTTTHGSDLDGIVEANERWSWVTRADGDAGGTTREVDATTGTVLDTTADAGYAPVRSGAWTYVIHRHDRLCCESVQYVDATDGTDGFQVPLRAFDLVADGDSVFARAQYGTDALAVFPAHGCGSATCTPAYWRPATAQSLELLALGDHHVFTTGDSGLLAFTRAGCGAAACTEAWRASGSGITGIAVAGGTVLVTRGATVEAYAEAGCGTPVCAPLWASTGGGTLSAPTVADGLVFAGSDDGSLRAWTLAGCGAASCPVVWTAPQGGPVGPVVVSTGSLYFTVGVTAQYDGVLRRLVLPSA
ncbi:MAG: hypothetical protein ACXVLO_16615 [Acidimicrobiia bacterium]